MHHYYYKCAKFHFNNSYPLLNYVQKWQFVVHASQQTTSVSKLSLTDIPIVHVLQRKQQLQSPINNLHLWEFLSWLCIFDNFIVKISTLQHNTFDSNNIQPGTLRLLAAAVWIETCTSSSPSRFNGICQVKTEISSVFLLYLFWIRTLGTNSTGFYLPDVVLVIHPTVPMRQSTWGSQSTNPNDGGGKS